MFADWSIWRTARLVVGACVLMAASYYLVVAFDNITNPNGPASNWPFVRGVLSMESVPPDDRFDWRAVDNRAVHVLFYVAIIAGETVAGLLLLWGGLLGVRRTADPAGWAAGQRLSLLGCGVGLLVFWFGFITVGGNWWIMYLNESWNGLDPAFQNATLTLGTALAVLLVAAAGERERVLSPES
jgi:predicted small integral membrane protein